VILWSKWGGPFRGRPTHLKTALENCLFGNFPALFHIIEEYHGSEVYESLWDDSDGAVCVNWEGGC
jgi:hypothetical protein